MCASDARAPAAALVLRDDLCGSAEDAGQNLVRLLRVKSLGKFREACQVREQDTDLHALGTVTRVLGGKRARNCCRSEHRLDSPPRRSGIEGAMRSASRQTINLSVNHDNR